MRKLLLLAAMALATALFVPAYGQVSVSVGSFDGGHYVGVSVKATEDASLAFQQKKNAAGGWMQDITAGVAVSSRFGFNAGWHRHDVGGGLANGPVAGFTGNCKMPLGFRAVYGVRGYPSMDNDTHGAGWSVGVMRSLGSLADVHVGHDWDRWWGVSGPRVGKVAGVSAGVSFRLGG